MKQEVWQLESAVGPLVFSHSMSWQRSPEVQTHTHTQSSHCCCLPQPTDPNMECSRKPMISWHSQAGGSKGKTPLKSPAFLHVRCEVENGEDSAKFQRVFSQAGEGESGVKPSGCWSFQTARKPLEFGENEGFLTQTDREKGQTLLIIFSSVCYLSLPVW